MKAANASSTHRQERRQMMNDATYLPASIPTRSANTTALVEDRSFPASLISHTSNKIDESITFLRDRFSDKPEIVANLASITGNDLLCQLIRIESIDTNRKLSDLGNKLARSIRVLTLEFVNNHLLLYQSTDIAHLSFILNYYDEYLVKNKEIFNIITSHHQKVKEAEEWSTVAQDTSALKDYSIMAQAMGDKAWVVEANWRMAKHIRDFFFGELGPKFARKYLAPLLCRSDADEHPLVQSYIQHIRNCPILLADQSSSSSEHAAADAIGNEHQQQTQTHTAVVRVLDVGSCYNPLARSPDASYLQVTAVDLHPANNQNIGNDARFHVHTCDFLTVPIANDTTDVVVKEDTSELDASGEKKNERVTIVESIPQHFFHAVTMSLVLCYLPDPVSRAKMITQAYHTLQGTHGLLVIVEKDSILRNINHPSVKQDPRATWPVWRRAMWRLGFECVKYEYFRHAAIHSASNTNNKQENDSDNICNKSHSNNNNNNLTSVAIRMSHIMIFVTRKDLPHPVAPTVEAYHPEGLSTSEVGVNTSHEVVDYGNIGKTAEEIEQLWIKQDLESSMKS